MVRRNELACRDEWTRTLWEQGAFGEPEAASARPVDPATEIEVAALVRTGLETDAAASADVVLGEARLVSDATPPWRLPAAGLALTATPPWRLPAAGLALTAPPPPPAAGFDSRTAILRAREAYRERQKAAERRQASVALSDAAASFEQVIADADEPSAAFAAASRGADPVDAELPAAPSAIEEEFALPLSAAPGSEWNGHAPELDWIAAASETDPVGPELAERPLASDETDPLPAAANDPAHAGDDVTGHEPAFPWEAIPVEPIPEQGNDWSPAPSGRPADPATAGGADWSPVTAEASEDEWWEPVPGAALPAWQPEPDADGGWRGTPVWDEAWIAELARESARGEHWAEWDLDTEDEEPAEPGPQAADRVDLEQGTPFVEFGVAGEVVALPPAAVARIDVAPGVPRICRTCRDFRPADGGDRGWCANQWAFTHRRLVDPEEPAPCESSIGNWWLPADELYIGDADISAHGLATPLLDRWVPGHVVAEPERKQS